MTMFWYQWRKQEDGESLGESTDLHVAESICAKLANEEILPEGKVTINLYQMPGDTLLRQYRDSEVQELQSPAQLAVQESANQSHGHGAASQGGHISGYDMQNAFEKTKKLKARLHEWGLPKEASVRPYYLLFEPDGKTPVKWTKDLTKAQAWQGEYPSYYIVDSRTLRPAKLTK